MRGTWPLPLSRIKGGRPGRKSQYADHRAPDIASDSPVINQNYLWAEAHQLFYQPVNGCPNRWRFLIDFELFCFVIMADVLLIRQIDNNVNVFCQETVSGLSIPEVRTGSWIIEAQSSRRATRKGANQTQKYIYRYWNLFYKK